MQAIPGMLLALVLCFEHRRAKEIQEGLPSSLGPHSHPRNSKYAWYATVGYAVGLISALAAGVLTRAPQPALLYLVISHQQVAPCLICKGSTAFLHGCCGEERRAGLPLDNVIAGRASCAETARNCNVMQRVHNRLG